MTILPNTLTPEALAEHMGWSVRRVRKVARDLGACRIMGNRMVLCDDDVKAILASQGAEATLLTLPTPPPPPQAKVRAPKQSYIYVVDRGGFVKIGYSTDPRGRVSNLQVSSPREITILEIFEGSLADERALHVRFAAQRVRGEWFKREGDLAKWVTGGCKP